VELEKSAHVDHRGAAQASFVYDGLGRRQRKTITGTITDFVYDGFNPVRETSGATIVNLLTGLGIDEYLMRTTGGTTEQFLTDGLGSTMALSDSNGAVDTEYSYEPFGTATTISGESTNELSYTGRESDNTGLSYYRARYYHPGLARFISEDPTGFAGGGVNLFAYVANDPMKWTDPLGLEVLNPQNLPVQPPVLETLYAFNRHIGLCKDVVITGGDRPGDPESPWSGTGGGY
jgi:RHS repeat-associated protein